MKDSGIEWIGEIPENLNIINTKYLIKYEKGKNPENTNIEGIGIPYVGASDLDHKNGVDNYSSYTESDVPKCQHGDILILWDGARAGLIGNRNEGAISSTIVKLLPESSVIDKTFYFYYLKGFENFLYDMVGGTTIPHMNRKFIEDIKFIDFSLLEQTCIANYLDTRCTLIDQTIEKQKQVIEKLKEYKQSVITEAVTKGLNQNVLMKDSGSVYWGEMPENWTIKRLKYVFSIVKRIAGKEGYNVLSITQNGIKVKDLSNNEGQIAQDYSNYQLVEVGDFAMNHMDLLTGWVDVSKYNGVTSPDYRVFIIDDEKACDSRYYLHLMQTCYRNKIFYGLGQGVSSLGRWRLQADKFLNFLIPVPSLEEQKAIAEYIDDKCKSIDAAISVKGKVLEKLESYKKSLIYECVTGKREVN